MSEDFSQKEILGKLWDETQKQSTSLTTLVVKMQDVEKHLLALNGKVAEHEKKLSDHSTFITKATAYATIGASVFTLLINKYL